MEICFILSSALLLLLSLLLVGAKLRAKPAHRNLPPGRLGWPLLGESMDFLRANWEGRPDKFVRDRVERYGSRVFKTSFFGQPMVFLCGPAGNKFLFSNEGKKVAMWQPPQIRRSIGRSLIYLNEDEARARRKLMMAGFFNAESLKKCVPTMDEVTRSYMEIHWSGKEEVRIYSSVKLYTFQLACRLFMSITEPELVARLHCQFKTFLTGLVTIPLKIPGTPFHRAMRAADSIRAELHLIMKQRRSEIETKAAFSTQDVLSYLISNMDGNGKSIPDAEVVNDMLTLLFAGHDTTSSALALLVKYLGEQHRVYENVLREQREIAASKAPGEPIKWEDLQKMKYSEKVVFEVLRIAPPVIGSIKTALVDITFDGYTIPKGWKLWWSAPYTHKDPSCYPNPMEFEESRFEGTGPPPFSYVPFGGGPRMCLGKELARFNILVFLHNLVTRFDWELLDPNEKLTHDPMLCPADGLPVRLQPREFSD